MVDLIARPASVQIDLVLHMHTRARAGIHALGRPDATYPRAGRCNMILDTERAAACQNNSDQKYDVVIAFAWFWLRRRRQTGR